MFAWYIKILVIRRMSIRWWQELDRYSKRPLPILMLMMSALLWNYHIKLIFYSDESMKILLTKDFRTISFENIHKLEKCFRYKHNSKCCWVDGLKKKKNIENWQKRSNYISSISDYVNILEGELAYCLIPVIGWNDF